jgi:hypothetical protein
VRYALLDQLGWINQLFYWIQNNIVRIAVRGDMARPRIEIEGLVRLVAFAQRHRTRSCPCPSSRPCRRASDAAGAAGRCPHAERDAARDRLEEPFVFWTLARCSRMSTRTLYAVLLAGGSGTRLLAREPQAPAETIPRDRRRALDAVRRPRRASRAWSPRERTLGGDDRGATRRGARRALPDVLDANLIAEPCGRNTAAERRARPRSRCSAATPTQCRSCCRPTT